MRRTARKFGCREESTSAIGFETAERIPRTKMSEASRFLLYRADRELPSSRCQSPEDSLEQRGGLRENGNVTWHALFC